MGIHQNFVGGRWSEASKSAPNVNPSNTRDVIGEYARGTKDDANRAIEAAKAAFAAWSHSSPQVRYEALKKVSDEILARKEELGRLLAREEGKILAEGIGEVVRAGQIFAFFAGEALRIAGEKLASVPQYRCRDHARAGRRRRPDYSVELSNRHSGLENCAGARIRQYCGVQTRRSRAGLRLGRGGHFQSLGLAGRRVQPGHGARLGGRGSHS